MSVKPVLGWEGSSVGDVIVMHHEDLSAIPGACMKKPCVLAQSYNTVLERWKQEAGLLKRGQARDPVMASKTHRE